MSLYSIKYLEIYGSPSVACAPICNVWAVYEGSNVQGTMVLVKVHRSV